MCETFKKVENFLLDYSTTLISEQILLFTHARFAVNAVVQKEDLPRFATFFDLFQLFFQLKMHGKNRKVDTISPTLKAN